MPVDTPLDYTPFFTFSTLQTSSEILNIFITSFIIVLILANLGSSVSKLVFFQRSTSFSYPAWIRAFVFSHSDDPLRLLYWIRGRYPYTSPSYTRPSHRLRLRRLVLPLLARLFLLLISVLSVFITIPKHKTLQGCDTGDYKLVFNETAARFTSVLNTVCIDIPLVSSLGSVFATAAYCNCPVVGITPPNEAPVSIHVNFQPRDSIRSTYLNSGGDLAGSIFYVEWKQTPIDDAIPSTDTLRSDIGQSLETEVHANIVQNAVLKEHPDCRVAERNQDPEDFSIKIRLEGCTFNVTNTLGRVDSYVRNALQWQRILRVQRRWRYVRNGALQPTQPKPELKCAIPVVVSRPLVNILPLLAILAALVLVNVLISVVVSKHGDALDAAFHIIKEALGHDTTCNPLQESVRTKEIMELECRHWQCHNGEGHLGYIGREGEEAVDGLDKNQRVGTRLGAREEIVTVETMKTAPSSFQSIRLGAARARVGRKDDVESGSSTRLTESPWMTGDSSDAIMGYYWSRAASGEVSPVPSSQMDDPDERGQKTKSHEDEEGK